VAVIEQAFNVEFFPSDVYVISGFPSEMRFSDVMSVILMSLGLSFLATIYPSWRASRLDPAEALRYE